VMRHRDTIDASGRMIAEGTYRTWFGVPRYLYRECLEEIVSWLRAALARRADDRFHHELRLRYCVGFFRTRWAAWAAGLRRSRKSRQLSSALRAE
jgi:hypothetical protein